jgi:hypothetical protein
MSFHTIVVTTTATTTYEVELHEQRYPDHRTTQREATYRAKKAHETGREVEATVRTSESQPKVKARWLCSGPSTCRGPIKED